LEEAVAENLSLSPLVTLKTLRVRNEALEIFNRFARQHTLSDPRLRPPYPRILVQWGPCPYGSLFTAIPTGDASR
jgi:hypothetical protein